VTLLFVDLSTHHIVFSPTFGHVLQVGFLTESSAQEHTNTIRLQVEEVLIRIVLCPRFFALFFQIKYVKMVKLQHLDGFSPNVVQF